MSDLAVTARTKAKRVPKRVQHDRETIYAILDAAWICHLGFVSGDSPSVIPTSYVRIDDSLYIHGSRVSRMIQILEEGAPACITVTHLDGLVIARSGFHCSANYRSVLVYGWGEKVADEDKIKIMDAFLEKLIPGRSAEWRPHKTKEINATTVIRFSLNEASAKIRSGPPSDDKEDYALPVWAGVIPYELQAGAPIDDPALAPGIPLPEYLKTY